MKPMSSSFLFFNRPPKKKLAVPARTYEEFLLSQNLDNWPRFPYMQELDISPLIAKLKKDYPLKTLTKYLRDNVPLVTETISNLEKRVQECKIKVDEHVKYTFALESGQSEIDNQGLSVPKEVADTSTEPQDIRRNKKLKVAADIIQDTNCKTVENFKFPGFNVQKLTKLPNNLEPARLWDSVLKVQTFKGVNVKVLKKLFFSEASLAILQDCFWWWFLHKFKPDEDEQDHFFDRISDSFVALLLSTPNYIKDPFFQMYPDCLSQTIYVSFCEAFPESYRHFNDEFKEELMDLVFQWIRGFKPRKFAWKEWKIWLLLKQKRDSFTKSSSFIKPLHQSRSYVLCQLCACRGQWRMRRKRWLGFPATLSLCAVSILASSTKDLSSFDLCHHSDRFYSPFQHHG